MPLFKFIRPEIWRWNLWFDGPKRLKYRVRYFDLRCYEMFMAQTRMQDDKGDLTGMRNNNRIPKFIEEKGSDSAWGNVVSLGKMIVYYCIGLER